MSQWVQVTAIRDYFDAKSPKPLVLELFTSRLNLERKLLSEALCKFKQKIPALTYLLAFENQNTILNSNKRPLMPHFNSITNLIFIKYYKILIFFIFFY